MTSTKKKLRNFLLTHCKLYLTLCLPFDRFTTMNQDVCEVVELPFAIYINENDIISDINAHPRNFSSRLIRDHWTVLSAIAIYRRRLKYKKRAQFTIFRRRLNVVRHYIIHNSAVVPYSENILKKKINIYESVYKFHDWYVIVIRLFEQRKLYVIPAVAAEANETPLAQSGYRF